MKNLYSTTRGNLIRYRLAFSILAINLAAFFLITISPFSCIVRICREDLIRGYYCERIDFWSLCAIVLIATTILLGISIITTGVKTLTNPQTLKTLNPRFNAWHDSSHPIVRISGFVLSLSCYLLMIVAQLFGIFGINYNIGNLMFVYDFVSDYFRNYHYIELLDFLALCGCITSLICVIIAYACWRYLTPNPHREEKAS